MKKKVNKKQILFILIIIVMLIGGLFVLNKPKVEEPQEIIEVYRIGLVENQKTMYEPLLKAYEAYRLNHGYAEMNYEVIYFDNGREVISALNSNDLELAFCDSYSIAKSTIADNVEALATKNDDETQNYYRAQLLRRTYASYDELQNRNFDYAKATYCVMAPPSISGYLGVMPFFKEKNLKFVDLDSIQITSYEEGIEKLASGECSVSVGHTKLKDDYREIWEELEGSEGSIDEEVQIVYTSEKLYENGVLYRDAVDSEIKESLLALLEANHYDEVTKDDFDYLRTILKEYLGG